MERGERNRERDREERRHRGRQGRDGNGDRREELNRKDAADTERKRIAATVNRRERMLQRERWSERDGGSKERQRGIR